MNIEKLITVMKSKCIHIPFYLIENYQSLKINERELILLGFLMGQDSLIDYGKIATSLKMSEQDVLSVLTNLQEKDLLAIKVVKNKDGIMEEHLSLDNLYYKLALDMIEDNNKEDTTTNIYTRFEKEFGRTLSSMEYEIISSWLDSNYSEDIIIEALREAVYNGASNLRYIDRILYEWNKKGLKNINDVKREKEKFAKKKQEKIEIPDYNWLDDHEEN